MWQRLGQHFLHDQMVVEQISDEIFQLQQKLGATSCMEIWPWKAVLTSYLIDRFDQLVLFEIDTKLRNRLEPFESRGKAHIIWWDILQQEFKLNPDTGKLTLPEWDPDILAQEKSKTEKKQKSLTQASSSFQQDSALQDSPILGRDANTSENESHSRLKQTSIPPKKDANTTKIVQKSASDRPVYTILPSKTLVVGNLPYYITSPILRKFFVDNVTEFWLGSEYSGGVFLVQKEVAEKIITAAKKKSYLRRLLNYNYQIDYCFTVASTFFTPPPKVDSAVIKIEHMWAKLPLEKFQRLLRLLDIISPYKRKTLGKIRKMENDRLFEFNKELPAELNGKRLEEISRDEMKVMLG